ncbi:MAG: hypothetical protein U0791_10675 [Gemmataceae bacterium]
MGWLSRFFGPPDRKQFAKIMERAIRRAGATEPCTFDEQEFRLVYVKDGKESRVLNLTNLHLEYNRLSRKDRSAWLKRTCVAIVNPMTLPEDFEDVKPDLFPSVRPRGLLERMRLDALVKGAKPPEVAHQPLSDHLVACLVYDLPASIQFVMQETFDAWNVTPYEAMEIALENLAARECPMMQLGDGFFIIETGDSYDATRLLMKDRVRKLPFQGRPVAMPLSRNTLFMTGSEDENGLGIMAHLATEKENDARPLCAVPVILRDDEWETWLPPADHPHYEAFHLLELKYLGGEYADMKPLLEQRNEQTETNVFVASFATFEKDGRVRSFGTWSKGVPTWLPKTDFIAFFHPETEATNIVEWDRVQEVIGDRMIPLECYPPRWSVDEDSFPNDDELARMGAENRSKN